MNLCFPVAGIEKYSLMRISINENVGPFFDFGFILSLRSQFPVPQFPSSCSSPASLLPPLSSPGAASIKHPAASPLSELASGNSQRLQRLPCGQPASGRRAEPPRGAVSEIRRETAGGQKQVELIFPNPRRGGGGGID